MELEEYKQFIKTKREQFFCNDKPYDLIYRNFEEQGYFKKNASYFLNNASEIVESIRKVSWEDFQSKEQDFTSQMLSSLYSEKDINKFTNVEAINWFVEKFPVHIYSLNLSNTQSRRSRAGKEFEAIIELILVGANIPMDSQGNIGKNSFLKKGLGKMVDLVVPGAIEYTLNKRDTVLISAKTTLRERWQEVPEEMGRTGAREMFLVTLDENISKDVIENLNESNIQIVTTRNIKQLKYKSFHNVIDFEKLLLILNETSHRWDTFEYSKDIVTKRKSDLEEQLSKHENHLFVESYYKKILDKYSEII